jgi:hypothetical protein
MMTINLNIMIKGGLGLSGCGYGEDGFPTPLAEVD